MVIHYADDWISLCGREMANYRQGQPIMQHTMLPESVTCKQCLKKLKRELDAKEDEEVFSNSDN